MFINGWNKYTYKKYNQSFIKHTFTKKLITFLDSLAGL